MTNRETLMSVVERLDDDEITRLLGYADALARLKQPSGASRERQAVGADGMEDPLLALIGVGRSAEPTNVAEKKDDYLAEAFGNRGR